MDHLEIKAALAVSEAGEITGIAWPFDSADIHGDVIVKGAFSGTADSLPMLFGHNPEDVIGLWEEVRETPEGLQVKGRLFVEQHPRAKAIQSLIKSKLIGGLSVGFHPRAATPRPGKGRTITKLDLVEVSVVRHPAHPRARILSAKSATASLVIAAALSRAAQALKSRKDV